MALTSDNDGGRSFDFITHTAVCATVFRLAFPDMKLQSGATLLHLVFLAVAQHIFSLLPLHRSAGFGDLTAEFHSIALLHLDILQFFKKFDGLF